MAASGQIVCILALCLLVQVICREVSLPTLTKGSIRRLARVRGGARSNDRRYSDVRKANAKINYNRASDDAPPRYRASTHDDGRYDDDYDGRDGRDREPYVNEVVASYTQSAAGKALVAVSAAVGTIFVVNLIQSIILSHTFWKLNYAAGAVGALFVFLRGDWTTFFRSLGVFLLLILRRATPQHFIPRFVQQLQASFYLTDRRPFPPPRDDDPDVVFSGFQSMVSLFVAGSVVGWNLVKPIPLFPSWLGGLFVACVVLYTSTFTDATGDLLRFVGYTVATTWQSLMSTANDVDLRDQTMNILGHTLFFLNGMDQQFQLRRKLQYILGEVIAKATMLVYATRLGGSNGNGNGNGNAAGYYRRRGRMSEQEDDSYDPRRGPVDDRYDGGGGGGSGLGPSPPPPQGSNGGDYYDDYRRPAAGPSRGAYSNSNSNSNSNGNSRGRGR